MPDWKSYLRKHLSLPQMRGHREERIISELADHLEDLYREALARGASEKEARAHVEKWLGDTDLAAHELIRSEPAHVRAKLNRWVEGREEDLRSRGRRWRSLADVLRDLRMALRALAKRPLFTGVVVLVLALGIGASTAIFTLVEAIILSPLPFEEPDRLITVSHTAPARGIEDAGQCAAWHFTYEDENRVFEDLGMYGGRSVAVTGVGDPEAVPAMYVTSGVLRAIRAQPVLGRIFTPEDDEPGAPATVILGHGYWQTRFGEDPEVIGRTLRVEGRSQEIIGVMPPTLRSLGRDPALVFTMNFDRSTLFVGNIGFDAVARLRDGVTLEQAHADVARMLPLAWEKFPGGPVASSSSPDQYSPVLRPLKDDLVGSVANLLWVILGGVGVVLLIACANVANLFLVRAEGKETEMAVRTAMGASARRIGWEYLKESLLLGVLGGLGGVALAQAGLRGLVALAPSRLPRMEEVSINPEVLLFTLALSLGAGLFFGMFPVLKHGRSDLVEALKEGGPRGISGRAQHRTQNVLAVSQMALALLLLVSSGLMVRSFLALRNVDPGFRNAEEILALRLYIPSREVRDPAEMAATHELIDRRLAEIPGVASVGLATAIPMDGSINVNPFYVDGVDLWGGRPPPIRRHKWIGEGYFETLEIPLLAGRTFTWEDVHNRFAGAILSESLAREYFGSPQAALGQRVAARPDPPRWHEVVGVVADVREDGVDQAPVLEVYWPQVTLAFWEGEPPDEVDTWRTMGYAIRSSRAGTPDFLGAVRDAIWSVNPNLPLMGVRTLPDLMARSVARTSFTLVLLGIAGSVALVLGIIGVYGVITYAVSQRTRELGLRIALGARADHVRRMVLRQGLILSGIGVAIGLGLAFGLTRLMAGLLFGVSAVDPITFLSVAAGLTTVALLASYLPARRAARVDPMTVLRAE
jgi:predicted permease